MMGLLSRNIILCCKFRCNITGLQLEALSIFYLCLVLSCNETLYLDVLEQSLRVVSHERLGDLLKVLKSIVHKYTELNSQGILNAAEDLINHIKSKNIKRNS